MVFPGFAYLQETSLAKLDLLNNRYNNFAATNSAQQDHLKRLIVSRELRTVLRTSKRNSTKFYTDIVYILCPE